MDNATDPSFPSKKSQLNLYRISMERVPVIIILVTLLATAVVHFSWRYVSHQNIVGMTQQLNATIASSIIREIDALLGNASSNLTFVKKLLLEKGVNNTDTQSLEKIFLATLQSNPTFSWVTLGFPNGDFFGAQRQGPQSFRSVERRWNPETKLSQSTDRFFQQEDDTLLFTHSAVNNLAYFAPERAWYRNAVQSGGKIWTDVYIYASSQKPGIDVAIPLEVKGQLTGVVAIGMELGQISDYLAHIAVGKSGVSFIINKNAELIAYQDISEVVITKNVGEELQLGHLASSAAPMLKIAAQATERWNLGKIHALSHQIITVDGMEYIVTVSPSGHADWLTGTVIPFQEFTEHVDAIQNKLFLAIGTVILLLSILTFMGIRAFLIQPLLSIAELAAKVGQGDHEQGSITMASPFIEIHRLTHAMEQMGHDLSAMRAKALHHAEIRLGQEKSLVRLNQKLRKANDINSLCDMGLHFLIDELEIPIAALYLLEGEQQLRLQASHALQSKPEQIELEHSWLGTAILEKKMKILVGIPLDGFVIHTGTLDIKPHSIMAWPLIHDERALGVLVMGSMQLLSDDQYRFVSRALVVMGIAISGIQSALHKRSLMDELIHSQVELKETVETLQKTSDYKSQFLANMSHEIRTPMNAIIGMSHLALKTNLTDKQYDYLNKIRMSSQSLLGIINDILDFSKIEAGEMRIEKIAFNLDETLDSLANMVSIKAEEKGLQLLFSRPETVPNHLLGDSMRLGQILINLTNNAVKFTEKGEIYVGVERIQEKNGTLQFRFVVQDTGIGLTQAQADKLFQPFSQADTSTTRKYGGTGLGLSICKRLVEMMDGTIEVTSQPGEGSRFSFTAWFGSCPMPQEERSLRLAADFRGMKVLVVDHNERLRKILGEIMTSLHFESLAVDSGLAALHALETTTANPESKPYQLVLINWKMSPMDGIEVARKIKHNKNIAKQPYIIVMTPYNREEVIPKEDRHFLDGFLAKPITPSQLFSTVLNTFNRGTESSRKARKPLEAPDKDSAKSIVGATVLLADDNKINQQVATELLESMGLLVTVVNNGREAMEAVGKTNFDIVLMDIQMPEMDGLQATQEIRKNPYFKTLPILAMTAHAMTGDREKSLKAGMDDHITKPIDPDRLLAALVRWIPVKERGGVSDGGTKKPEVHGEKNLPKQLPGIDWVAGLKQVAGNRALFEKLLKEFYQDYHDVVVTLRTALEQGDEGAVLRLSHTIKGIAGSLGAKDLYRIARDLESSVQSGQSETYKTVLDQFEKAIMPVFQGITSLESISPPTLTVPAVATPLELTALTPHFRELAPMLYAGLSSSEEKLQEIMEHLAGSEYAHMLKQVQEQVEEYEFKKALESFEKLAQSLGIVLDSRWR